MNSEIISVGTEILLGDIISTHPQFISRQLASLGIDLLYHVTVGDNKGRIKDAVNTAVGRSDLVILTGGLGPTDDDLTKEAVCETLGIRLNKDIDVQIRIEDYFKKLGRPMPKNNLKQAMVPEQCKIFYNDYGTAPGLAVRKAGKCVIMLPGPPEELIPMFNTQVYDFLKHFTDSVIISRNIKFFGIGESEIAKKFGDITDMQNPTVALYAKDGETHARITAKAQTEAECNIMIDIVIKRIQKSLNRFIYGIDVSSLEQVVVEMLIQNNMKISTAESCTGGLLSKKITSIPGASDCYEYGITSYSNRVKNKELGVRKSTLREHGAVSCQTAKSMAKGVREKSGADIGVSITGIAGPSGATEQKPLGLVFVGVSTSARTYVKQLNLSRGLPDEREYIRNMATLHALNMVREIIEKHKADI